MIDPKYTVGEFWELSRDAMFNELRRVAPERAKGRNKTAIGTKEHLGQQFEEFFAEWQRASEAVASMSMPTDMGGRRGGFEEPVGELLTNIEEVRAACARARLLLVDVPEGELRPLRAIEAGEAWARGEATLSAVREAADSAACAARAYQIWYEGGETAARLATAAAKAAVDAVSSIIDTVAIETEGEMVRVNPPIQALPDGEVLLEGRQEAWVHRDTVAQDRPLSPKQKVLWDAFEVSFETFRKNPVPGAHRKDVLARIYALKVAGVVVNEGYGIGLKKAQSEVKQHLRQLKAGVLAPPAEQTS